MPKRFKLWIQAYQYARENLKLDMRKAEQWADQIMQVEPEKATPRAVIAQNVDPYS